MHLSTKGFKKGKVLFVPKGSLTRDVSIAQANDRIVTFACSLYFCMMDK